MRAAIAGVIILFQLTGSHSQEPGDLNPSLKNIRHNLYNIFSKPRNHIEPEHIRHKERVRDFIQAYLSAIRREPDILMDTIHFTVPSIKDYYNNTVNGTNYYLIYKGEKWNTTEDKIIVLASQYDTAAYSNGVDNNGSGMTSFLEVARLLALAHCSRPYTIVLVANDWEEYGSWGIKKFIHNFLVPDLLKGITGPESPEFQGAIVYDTMMNWNDTDSSQVFPGGIDEKDVADWLPEEYHWFNVTNRRRGNFMLSMSRMETDHPLNEKLHQHWRKLPQGDKYLEVQLEMWCTGVIVNRSASSCRTFLRADYKEFYAVETSKPLKAMMVTDSAQYRGVMQQCYAKPCDDLSQVTPQKLEYLTKICKATLDTLLDMSGYRCIPPTLPTAPPRPPCPTISGATEITASLHLAFVWVLYKALTMWSVD